MFGDIDGLSSEVGRSGIAGRGCGVHVAVFEALLELDGAYRRVDLQGHVKAGVMIAGERGEEFGGPGTRETTVLW